MKEQKLYLCEFCGTQYKDKDKALLCEKEHTEVKVLKDSKWHAGGKYPERVEVKFVDGTSHWYKR